MIQEWGDVGGNQPQVRQFDQLIDKKFEQAIEPRSWRENIYKDIYSKYKFERLEIINKTIPS